jgi:hypothetical protein
VPVRFHHAGVDAIGHTEVVGIDYQRALSHPRAYRSAAFVRFAFDGAVRWANRLQTPDHPLHGGRRK